MEYIPCGELFAAWKNSGSFNESVVRIYIAELGTVLGQLHVAVDINYTFLFLKVSRH